MYVKHAPGWFNLKRQQLVPRRTSTHESVSSLTTPEMLNRNNSGSSGAPSDTTSNIEFLSAFHFLNREIASSSEEIIVLALSDKFGVKAAPELADDPTCEPGRRINAARRSANSLQRPHALGVLMLGEKIEVLALLRGQ